MSITDELRKYTQSWRETPNLMDDLDAGDIDGLLGDFEHIADHIDAEAEDNERFRREAEPFCDRLREAAAEMAEVTMFGVDYVPLPVDADGVPIHVGDVMEWPTNGETFEVVGIGDGTLFYVEDGSECADWTGATTKRHHHAPTVEDVLREFAEKVIDSQIPNVHPTYEEAIAEYAAKLRLAGDAE